MRERLETMLEGRRFEDCRIPTAVSAYDVWARRAQLLDEGPMAPAVQASCAVPGMFHPVWIGGRPYVDGGVEDRAGLLGIDEGRVLYHHLGSRVPWPAVPLPPRPGVVALVLHGLPRPGPFRLEEGIRAYEAAQRATRKALDRPVLGGVALEHASGSSA
jgi:NTE family protein